MTAALKSLNFTTLRKLSTIQRSIVTYVVARLEEQKPLLADPISRDHYLVEKNEAGEISLVELKRRVLPWWTPQPKLVSDQAIHPMWRMNFSA